MANVYNTSYKVQADVDSEEVRLQYNIEEGAYVTTSAGVWTVYNGEWVKLYPQSGAGSGLGWTRYDDGQYTSASKLSLAQDTQVVLPNNGASVYRSYTGIDYYNSTTQKVLAENENDLYMATIVFKCQAPNANQTFLRLQLDSVNGTPYERVGVDIPFPKGNDVAHEFHQVFQYYATSDFVSNGSQWKITATGGTAQVWDIIFFISKIQNYG
jgi:hypothetical protein